MSSDSDLKTDLVQVAIVRAAIRETLYNPTLQSFEPMAIVIALELSRAEMIQRVMPPKSGPLQHRKFVREGEQLGCGEPVRPALP